MELIVKESFLLILLVILFYLNRKDRTPGESESIDELSGQIEMALALDQFSEFSAAQTTEPASRESLSALEERGIRLDRGITESEAIHLLGIFKSPSARQLEILKHFRVPKSQILNKSLANYHIHKIFSNPVNVKEWNQRPPTSRVRQGLLFMSGQLVNGLTQVEAQAKLLQYGMDNPNRYQEWKHIEKLFIEINDSANLERYAARKVTWKRFFQLYYTVKKSGVETCEINVELVYAHIKGTSVRQDVHLNIDDFTAKAS